MKHIILIGFKNTGKSVVGQELAAQLSLPFVDLDQRLEEKYAHICGTHKPCRKIMEECGQDFFRELEKTALLEILSYSTPCVLALGGSAPLRPENHELLKQHTIVHITAPKGIVYERITVGGRPAFFTQHEDSFTCFQRIWTERAPVYKQLAHCEIDNNSSIAEAVKKLKNKLHLCQISSC